MNNKYSIVVEAAVAAAQKELESLGQRSERAFDRARAAATRWEVGMVNSWRKVKGAWVEIAAGAIALQQAYSLAFDAAKFVEREQAFANLAASHGENAQKIIDGLKRMSGQTLDTMTIMEKAGTAMTLGIPAGKLTELMQIARATAKVTGQEVSQAFSDIVTAVGRQSQMILDNLGIIVKVGDANERYAAQLGKTATQLTDTEKKQAFLNATIDAGREVIERVGQTAVSSSEKMQQWQARYRDGMISIGKFTLNLAQGIELVFAAVGSTVNSIAEKVVGSVAWMAENALGSVAWMVEKFDKLPLVDFTDLAKGIRDAQDAASKPLRGLQGDFQAGATGGIMYMSDVWDEMVGVWQTAEPIVTTLNRSVTNQGEAAGTAAPKVRKLAEATKDLVDLWRVQAGDRYAVQSRALDYEIRAMEEAAREGVAAGQATPKDFWQIQAEERYEVHSRGLDAMIQAEEAASRHMQELSQRTAEAMEQTFSDLYFDVMRGKFDSFGEYVDGVLQAIARATADYLGQLMRVGLFGPTGGGGGGLVDAAISWIGGIIGMHDGGVVGRDYSFQRTMPAAAFAGAPRLHGGLLPDEFPAILQRGETVLPRGTAPVNITVNNNAPGTEARVECTDGGLNFEIIVERVEGAISGRMSRGTGLSGFLDSRYQRTR